MSPEEERMRALVLGGWVPTFTIHRAGARQIDQREFAITIMECSVIEGGIRKLRQIGRRRQTRSGYMVLRGGVRALTADINAVGRSRPEWSIRDRAPRSRDANPPLLQGDTVTGAPFVRVGRASGQKIVLASINGNRTRRAGGFVGLRRPA